MEAIEFQTTIKNGIVHIPKKYQALQKTANATIIIMYDKRKKMYLIRHKYMHLVS